MTEAEFGAQAAVLLDGVSPKHLFEPLYDKAQETRDWREVVKLLNLLVAKDIQSGGRVSDELQDNVIMSISSAVQMLDEDSKRAALDIISDLVRIASEGADTRALPERGEVLDLLSTLDLDIDLTSLTLEQAACLEDDGLRGMAEAFGAAAQDLPDLEMQASTITSCINEASKALRFGDLRTIAEEAEVIHRSIADITFLREHLHDRVRQALGDEMGYAPYDMDPVVIADAAPSDQGSGPSQDDEAVPLADTSSILAGDDAGRSEPAEAGADAEAVEAPAPIEVERERPRDEKDSGPVDHDPDSSDAPVPEGFDDGSMDRSLSSKSEIIEDEPHDGVEHRIVEPADPTERPADGSDAGSVAPLSSGARRTEPVGVDAPDNTGATAAPHEDAEPASLDPTVLVELLSENLIGLAGDAAAAVEASGRAWPIGSATLRVAAASRARHDDYGSEMQRFLAMATVAVHRMESDLGANLLFGALLRPALLQHSFGLRPAMPELTCGALGPSLMGVADAVAGLAHDFPPSADTLAKISGAKRAP